MTDKVTIRVTASAGRMIPGVGSFQAGETFELDADQVDAVIHARPGLEVVRPPVQRRAPRSVDSTGEAPLGVAPESED